MCPTLFYNRLLHPDHKHCHVIVDEHVKHNAKTIRESITPSAHELVKLQLDHARECLESESQVFLDLLAAACELLHDLELKDQSGASLARSVASLQAWSLPHQGRHSSQGALAPALFLPRRMGYRTNGRRVRYGRGRGVRKLGREAAAPDDRERSGERV
jgi:hypothetical protein